MNITMNNLSNQLIPYINTAKVGSHTEYKLRFTNPNDITVWTQRPNLGIYPDSGDIYRYSQDYCDTTWIEALNISQPGLCKEVVAFESNDYSDNCLLVQELKPGESCAYYVTAFWANNYTPESMFSYPLGYSVGAAQACDDSACSISVQQYWGIDHGESWSWVKDNESDLGEQFIHYTISAIESNNLPVSIAKYGIGTVSADGNWFYPCLGYTVESNLQCGKYPLYYDSVQNTLTIGTNPTISYTLHNFINLGLSTVVNYDGSSAWIAGIDQNSKNVILKLGDVQESYYTVPRLASTYMMWMIAGLDNSIWLHTQSINDIYDAHTDSFESTNIPGKIIGVEKNGVVIATLNASSESVSGIYCYRTNGSSTQYTAESLSNFSYTTKEFITWANGIYVKNGINNLVEIYAYTPNLITLNINKNGYFRIHTENGLCEIRNDDYVYVDPILKHNKLIDVTEQYAFIINDVYDPKYAESTTLIPISQVYLGKEESH